MSDFFLEEGIASLVSEFIENGRPSIGQIPIEQRRAGYLSSASLAGKKKTLHQIFDIEHGEIALRVYQPSNESDLPVVVYFHGGCFVSGCFETHDQQLREIASQSGAIVIAAKYRLAPEHVYPAAHDDAFHAAQYVFENCQALGGDRSKIILMGDSAGGHLALITSFRLKAAGNWLPNKQVLIYPMLDATASSRSYQENGQDFIITKEALLSGFNLYRGNTEISARHPEISPFFRDDLQGLPETHIITAEYDPLVGEGEGFYQKLLRAGVSAQCRRYCGVIHGFYQLSAISCAARESIKHLAYIVRGE